MQPNPWLPMLLGLGSTVIPVLIITQLPETLGYMANKTQSNLSTASSSDNSKDAPTSWKSVPYYIQSSMSFLIHDYRVLLVLSGYLFHTLLLNRDVLLQYISTHHRTSLARAAALISIRSGLIVLLCLFILPAAKVYFGRKMGSERADLSLARASAMCMALSFLAIGLAPNYFILIPALVFNSCGWGLYVFLRSLGTSLVDADHVALLNSFIGVIDTIGHMFGSPLLALLFRRGLELGGFWTGLPIYFCAGAVASTALVLFAIRIQRLELG